MESKGQVPLDLQTFTTHSRPLRPPDVSPCLSSCGWAVLLAYTHLDGTGEQGGGGRLVNRKGVSIQFLDMWLVVSRDKWDPRTPLQCRTRFRVGREGELGATVLHPRTILSSYFKMLCPWNAPMFQRWHESYALENARWRVVSRRVSTYHFKYARQEEMKEETLYLTASPDHLHSLCYEVLNHRMWFFPVLGHLAFKPRKHGMRCLLSIIAWFSWLFSTLSDHGPQG